MACVGIIMSTVGMDPMTSRTRFTFGIPDLMDGFELVYVAMGLFGMSEVLLNLSQPFQKRDTFSGKIRNLFPTREDWKTLRKTDCQRDGPRILLWHPARFWSRSPHVRFLCTGESVPNQPVNLGTGVIEGVAGPEAANNAASSGTFIPLLSLGIPPHPSTAVILGALMILWPSAGAPVD